MGIIKTSKLVHEFIRRDEEGNVESITTALDNVNLDIKEGQFIAILGHNGSGKSTLAKTINGLITPNEGEILVKGEKVSEDNLWDVRRMIGMVFQNPDNQFVGSTVEDDVAFGLENQGVPREDMLTRVKDALETVRMADFSTKEPARLSGGQKQRVAIASGILSGKDVMIMDEPTSGLDLKHMLEVNDMIQQLRQYQVIVIIISHDREFLNLCCDEIIEIADN